MKRSSPFSFAFIIAFAFVAANSDTIDQHADNKVVYGSDNRRDVYQLGESNPWRQITERSIVALVDRTNLGDADNDGVYHTLERGVYPDQFRLGNVFNLCSNQTFLLDPTLAFCSGTLIAPDRVVTAGHCVDILSCATTSLLFKYYVTGRDSDGYPNFPEITEEDVFNCIAVDTVQTNNIDFAVIFLDRVVNNFEPISIVNDSSPVHQGDHVTIIGFPSGIPAKIDTGGRVTTPRPSQRDYFLATTDSFAGNSGSGVFSSSHEQVGVLVSGATDYVSSSSDSFCNVVNVISHCGSGCGERITYAYHAALAVPDCTTDSECGGHNQTCYRTCPDDSNECTGFCVFDTDVLGALSLADVACGETISGTTENAHNIIGSAAGDKVFRLVLRSGSIVLIDACASTYDTALWLFNVTETGYSQVAYNDDSSCGLRSRIEQYLSPGVYYIIIGGYANEEGSFSFDISCAIEKDTASGKDATSSNSSSRESRDDAIGLILLGATGMGIAMMAVVGVVVFVLKPKPKPTALAMRVAASKAASQV